MKILITAGIFPPKVGGPATYVPRIAKTFTERGHKVEILTPGKNSKNEFPYPVHRTVESIPWRFIDSTAKILNRVQWADCIYDNALSVDVYLASFFHNVPTIQKIVGDRSWERYRNNRRGHETIDEFQTANPPYITRLRQAFQHKISQAMERIIVPSQYLKSIVKQWGVSEKRIDVIYNTAHQPESIPSKSNLNWPTSDLKLLTVGRLVPWKRVPQLINTLSDSNEGSLVILGDGPDYERCKTVIKENKMQSRVKLKGNVPGHQVWAHLNQADVFLLNSSYEGFPHVLLEAMACGTPVVAAASGGTAETVEFFPDKIHLYDPDKTKKMLDILQNAPLKSFNPVDFPDKLQWNTIVDQTEALLESVCKTQ